MSFLICLTSKLSCGSSYPHSTEILVILLPSNSFLYFPLPLHKQRSSSVLGVLYLSLFLAKYLLPPLVAQSLLLQFTHPQT